MIDFYTISKYSIDKSNEIKKKENISVFSKTIENGKIILTLLGRSSTD